MPRHFIHGHAIVSADDRYATAAGAFPPELLVPADQQRFQAALDEAALVVLGRAGHLANPNRDRRTRLVLHNAGAGLERRADAWWWNPAAVPLGEALARAAPAGGGVAVVGGMQVLDLFLEHGFDAFDLARAEDVRLPDGRPLFGAVAKGESADAVLAAAGLGAAPPALLQARPRVVLTLWRRPPS